MKKKGRRKDGNIILFPDLEKRLLEKGLEELHQRKFKEAIRLFEEAKEMDSEDADVYVGLVLAYYEMGELERAKQFVQGMLKEGMGEYFQTIDLYLMILVQLHDYQEIITTIEMLEEESEIPIEKQEHFAKLLAFSQRMAESMDIQEEPVDRASDSPEAFDLLELEDSNQQLLAITELSHKNIRSYIENVKKYLESRDGHPFFKTMLIHILQEQEYDKEVIVEKFGEEKAMIPTSVVPFRENEQWIGIQKELVHLESKNPTLFQQIISLVERHLFLVYPFELQPDHPSLWAAAYHLTALDYNGFHRSLKEIAEEYRVSPIEVEKASSFITKLEEISYPII